MEYPYSMKLTLELEDNSKAVNIEKALLPDLGRKDERRSKTTIKSNKNVLSVEIYAKDAVALRAAANSHLKLIALSHKILDKEVIE